MCDCIRKMNRALSGANQPPLRYTTDLKTFEPSRVIVAQQTRSEKNFISANYCPFCGEKYPEPPED